MLSNLSIWALTQDAIISTAGFDLADSSTLTHQQWEIMCPQLKPALLQPVDPISKNCSPRLAKVYQSAKQGCSRISSSEQGPSEAQTSAMMKAMCQAVSTFVSLGFYAYNVLKYRES